MNGLAHDISMSLRDSRRRAALGALIACLAAPAGTAWAAPCETASSAPAAPMTPADIAAQAEASASQPGAYPQFCAIPQAPSDMRPPSAWADSISALSQEGAATVAMAQAAFSDGPSTDAFTADALRDATPPPAFSSPTSTEEFVRSVRARATPPPRSR